MKSPKEMSLERKITALLEQAAAEQDEARDGAEATGKFLPLEAARALTADAEVHAVQDYANDVSIIRLGYNDHGPVHMRTVTRNAIQMLLLLRRAGIRTSLQTEEIGTFQDSLTAVVLAAFLHDLGMSVGRQDHELHSVSLALPIIERILRQILPDDDSAGSSAPENLRRRVVIRSMAVEGIAGHMGSRRVHSLEAGVILVADGCDMTKGRARIPMAISTEPKIGDIHKYSANSIEKVLIQSGSRKPVRIEVRMSSDVGFFQIEEVLLQKINCSTAKPHIELVAGLEGGQPKQYL